MYPVYMYIIQIKYIHKNLQNDDSEDYLHDTTHFKSQFLKTCTEP